MRTILITGGAKRIGRSIAIELAKEKNRLLIHYNQSQKDAIDLHKFMKKNNYHSYLYQANLASQKEIKAMTDQIKTDFNEQVDTIINCASIFHEDNAVDFTSEQFTSHINVNLLAPLLLSQFLIKNCNKDNDNNIINIIDQKVLKLNPSYFTYTLSKFSLWGATQTMAQEYSPIIRVNAIAPGPILANHNQTKEQFDKEANNTPLGKEPNISDISNAIKFILKTESVTGQIIAIDSGQHLSWKTQDFIESMSSFSDDKT